MIMDLSGNINQQLYEKASQEYQSFIGELKQMSPEKIIEKSYEKVFKEDICLSLENNDLPTPKAKALLALRYPLDELYHEWLNTDSTYMDLLQDCIENRARSALMEMSEKTELSNITLPDPTIDVSERNSFGYTYDGMLPLRQERAMELYSQNHCVYKLYVDNTEAMIDSASEITYHNGLFGIEVEDWRHIILQKEQLESAVQHGKEDVYAIYQLKPGDETRDYRYESLDHLKAHGLSVDKQNYDLVYSAPLTEDDTLDALFMRFNVDHPADFHGHSLSMSDVIVIHQNNETKTHYVDSVGFPVLSDFFKEKAERIADNLYPDRRVEKKASVSAQLQTANRDSNRADKPKSTPKRTNEMEM